MATKLISTSLPTYQSGTNGNGTQNGSKSKRPFIIGVAGGTASGKTSVCMMIIEKLGIESGRLALVSQDCFYKSLSAETLENVHEYNFDHPDAFDWVLIQETLKDLSEGKTVKIPEYDFVTHKRKEGEGTAICAVDIVIIEGILMFYHAKVLELMNMKLFVDTDADTRLSRRIRRDIKERGRDLEGVLLQYQKFVKPAFDEYILPSKKYADVIIPRGADNLVAVDLIVQHIRSKLARVSNRQQQSNNRNSKNTRLLFEFPASDSEESENEQFTFEH